MRTRLSALLAGALLLVSSSVFAQKIAEVVLWNGNTITGEVKSLQQGKLKFKTDHAGTIYIEWEFLKSVTSANFFEVENQQGEFFYGMLSAGPEERKLVVIGPTQTVVLDMEQVIEIMPIRKTFWGKVDGSLNLGLSFTSADNILQYSIESDATYRQRKYSAKITLSSIQTRIEIEQEDRETTFRDNLDFTYTRYLKNRNFVSGSLDFTRSSELGIDLRAEIGWALGRTFVQSIRTRLSAAAGLTVSRETPIVEEPSDHFLSAAILGRYQFFLYNYPKTDISVDLSVLPGITDWPRMRVNFNGSLKREIITDFTVNLSIFDSYDSDPPGGDEAANHDFGVILSVGWTF
jgi:hypothetical protein